MDTNPRSDSTPAGATVRAAAVEVPLADLRSRMGDALGRVRFGGDRLVLTSHGRAVAAIVTLEDLERIELDDLGGRPLPVVDERVELAATGPDVWRYLLDGRHRAPLWPSITLDACVGERVAERRLAADGTIADLRGEVVAVEPGTSVRWTWVERGRPPETTVVLRTVPAPDGPGTVLHVVESGFGIRGDERAQEHRSSWRELLDALHGRVQARPSPSCQTSR